LANAAGAKRAILLPVSAPFHCSLMRPAQEKLRADLHATTFKDLTIPLINNWQAQEIRAAEDARQGLFEQIPKPVRWTDTIREMARNGIKVFVEVGPGSVLSGLARNIDPAVQTAKFGEPADLEKVKRALA
jgi:[acyl-carrier-protein] S-malonyltransferase